MEAQHYDLVIRDGELIDPTSALRRRADLAVRGDRIAAVLDAGSGAAANRAIDARGLIVAPGFIDLHVHVFAGVSHYGVEVDPNCLRRGVTTAMDAGSAGALTFPGFRKYVIDVCETRLFALLNISAIGLVSGIEAQPGVGELEELRYCDVKSAMRVIEANRDRILGVKIRLSRDLAADGRNELPALLRAREACDAAGLPLMVHSPESSLPLGRILSELRSGDILTHCFHGLPCGIVDSEMKVLPEVRRKAEQGLLLDVGHGVGSFTFRVARAAMKQGVLPNTISSDLHAYNLCGPVFDLVTTVNKFLHLGLELDEAIRRVTTAPAQFLHMSGEIGTLAPGAMADVVVLELIEGPCELTDTAAATEVAPRRLEPRCVVRAGKVLGVLPRSDQRR